MASIVSAQFAGAKAEDVAQLGIDPQEAAFEVHQRDADGGLVEGAAKALFALAQCVFGELAARHVAHDAEHAALAVEHDAAGVQFDRKFAPAALDAEAQFVAPGRFFAFADPLPEALHPQFEEIRRHHRVEPQSDEVVVLVTEHAWQRGVGEDEAVVAGDEHAVRHAVEQGAEYRAVGTGTLTDDGFRARNVQPRIAVHAVRTSIRSMRRLRAPTCRPPMVRLSRAP